MTEEGIDYSPTGTIDVTFDDRTYHLGRPKLKQWRYFTRRIEEMSQATQDKLTGLSAAVREAADAVEAEADPILRGTLELATEELQKAGTEATRAQRAAQQRAWDDVYEAATPLLKAAYDQAQEAVAEFAKHPFYETSSELVREIFKQVGDPLPDDIDDWPVWLATDVAIPNQILSHWRKAPKASGSNGSIPTDRPNG